MELRMLSGLHRGAVLDLDEQELSLGASDQADVIVVDPGIAPMHLRIREEAGGYYLIPEDGEVLAADGSPVAPVILIARRTQFRIGEVWIGFYEHDDPWDAPPSEQDRPLITAPGAPVAAPIAAQAAPVSEPEPDPNLPPKRRTSRSTIWLLTSLLGLPLFVWLIAVAHASFQIETPKMEKATATRMAAEPLMPSAPPESPPPSLSTTQLMTAQLLTDFKRQLAERDLLDRVDLITNASGWDIRGTLDAEEQARLARLVASFSKARKLSFPLTVAVVPQTDMLPFKIVEITGGKQSNIVTDSGERLFVGDTLDGYRLVSVTPPKIIFGGKRRIELAW